MFLKQGRELTPGEISTTLRAYDDPEILLGQLSRLNSFTATGDLVAFGAFAGGRQINFEDQAGGHGSIGGEQLHPFLLAKRDWNVRTEHLQGAHELHDVLCALRDRLLDGGRAAELGGLH